MKSDEDVRMISAEAPVLFAKVCSCSRRVAKHCNHLLPSAAGVMIGTPCAMWCILYLSRMICYTLMAGLRDVHSGADSAIMEPL